MAKQCTKKKNKISISVCSIQNNHGIHVIQGFESQNSDEEIRIEIPYTWQVFSC